MKRVEDESSKSAVTQREVTRNLATEGKVRPFRTESLLAFGGRILLGVSLKLYILWRIALKNLVFQLLARQLFQGIC